MARIAATGTLDYVVEAPLLRSVASVGNDVVGTEERPGGGARHWLHGFDATTGSQSWSKVLADETTAHFVGIVATAAGQVAGAGYWGEGDGDTAITFDPGGASPITLELETSEPHATAVYSVETNGTFAWANRWTDDHHYLGDGTQADRIAVHPGGGVVVSGVATWNVIYQWTSLAHFGAGGEVQWRRRIDQANVRAVFAHGDNLVLGGRRIGNPADSPTIDVETGFGDEVYGFELLAENAAYLLAYGSDGHLQWAMRAGVHVGLNAGSDLGSGLLVRGALQRGCRTRRQYAPRASDRGVGLLPRVRGVAAAKPSRAVTSSTEWRATSWRSR